MRDWIIGSCILILAVLVIRKLFGTRISSRFRYALWAIVLVRLLCPVAFWNSTQLASQVTGIVRAQFSDASGRTNASQIDQASIDQTGEKNSSTDINTTADVNFRFHHMLSQKRKSKGHFEKLPVYQVAGLSSPCLFGLVHPAIYLCEEAALDPESLSMILQYETCHYRHKDHIWSVLRSLCLAIWWWNPLVWVAAVVSKRDCEMACDEGTLSRVGWDRKFLYAKTLVDAVADKRKFGMTVASTMVSEKSDTERRLCMMLNKKKTRMASMVLAAGIISRTSRTGKHQCRTDPKRI